ncbi:MAG: AMP-dependent synthetase/ligase [Bacteroidales bacterium]|jgi:long-chain acyl-CoA synthetase
MLVKRIFDLTERYLQLFPDKTDALAGKDEGIWLRYSVHQYIEIANNISYGLLKLGVQKGDKIASITFNRPEWNFLDMGIQQAGAIHIPIYPTISDSDYQYILNHAEVKYIFVAGEEMYRRIKHILPDVPSLKAIYTFKNLHGIEHLNELLELGKKNQDIEKLKKIKGAITEDDISTIIYTSGTTGIPKGVVLTHKNIISNFVAVSPIIPYGSEARALSFLPLCHIYERTINYMYQYNGISLYYAENIGTVVDNLKEIQPQIMTTVPRLLEKVYDKIISNAEKLNWLKKIIFYWSLNVGHHYTLYGKNSRWYNVKLKIARKLVFCKWREGLGNVDIIVSGGAALQPRLGRIFCAAGFRVLEGYGLTETSPVISVNTLDENGMKIGTVGPVIEGVEVKIAEDGEILCRGPNIMAGYYKEPELTEAVIDKEGWLHTGDIGCFVDDGLLKITGRKKEIFKTSFGKYISPQLIENKFKESPFIDNIFVIGENQKFAAAIIAPDFNYLCEWCKRKGIEYTDNKEILNLQRIKKRFRKEVDIYNSFFGDTEQIKRFELAETEWTIESGELTATLKLRRTFMHRNYKDVINKIFNN